MSIAMSSIQRAKRLIVGGSYFLSYIGREHGAMVVVKKQVMPGDALTPARVDVEVVELVGKLATYHKGQRIEVNPSHLYASVDDVK